MPSPTDLSDSIERLHISSTAPSTGKKSAPHKKKAEPIVDSWETASLSSDSEEEEERKGGNFDSDSDAKPAPPKPGFLAYGPSASPTRSTPRIPAGADRSERPAKTDAVARRIISAALGIRTRPAPNVGF
jgi:hypothetical protein